MVHSKTHGEPVKAAHLGTVRFICFDVFSSDDFDVCATRCHNGIGPWFHREGLENLGGKGDNGQGCLSRCVGRDVETKKVEGWVELAFKMFCKFPLYVLYCCRVPGEKGVVNIQ